MTATGSTATQCIAGLTADGTSLCIKVPVSWILVSVLTQDGQRFEASARGIGEAGKAAAIARALEYAREHQGEVRRLLAQLRS